jgi:alkanesulfonate monooxygenase SsuD/methylene tetrahydromethanopterin reductase-like flavin-dependent oxidoreductase (luciferase family)
MSIANNRAGIIVSQNDPYAYTGPSPEDLRAQAEQLQNAALKAEHDQRQAKITARIEANAPLAQEATQRANAGYDPHRTMSSRDVGVILPSSEIERTTLKLGPISYQQAKDMVDTGQLSGDQFKRMVADGVAARGFKVPPSFR